MSFHCNPSWRCMLSAKRFSKVSISALNLTSPNKTSKQPRSFWQTSLSQNRIGGMSARDSNWHRKVRFGHQVVPNFVTTLALPDHLASCQP